GSLSLSTWIYPNTSTLGSGQDVIVSKESSTLTNILGAYTLWMENGVPKFTVSNQNGVPSWYQTATAANALNANTWYHLTGVINFQLNRIELYVNGTLVGTQTWGGTIASNVNGRLLIGSHFKSNFGSQYMYNFGGHLDDIAIWNRALTASEIQQLYTLGNATYSWSPGGATTPSITVSPSSTTTYTCTATANGVSSTSSSVVTVTPAPTITATNTTVCAGQSTTLTAGTTSTGSGSNCPTLSGSLTTGLVGYWPFCGNANDASGNGNNGTVNGATLTVDRNGAFNSAFSFDGLSNYISGNIANFSNTSITSLSVWAKYIGDAGGQPYDLFFQYGAYGSHTFSYAYNYFAQNIDFYSQCFTNPYSSVNLQNNWHHIVVVDSLQYTKIYIDGAIFNNSVSGSNGNCYQGSNYFLIGGGGDNQYTTGSLDDIAIWNRALTASEIQALYTTGQTTYSWSNGATTPSITVSPTTTTTYTCTVTDANGNICTVDQTITVNPIPTVNAGADISVCSGSTATLTATGAASYSWTNNVQNGVAFTPTSTATYTVTGTSNGCTATDAVTVTVTPAPTITATNTTICAGQSTTLTANTTSTGSGSNCPTLSGSLTTGLVGYWPFCGNANDASGNGNNGTVNGATLTTDRFGNASSAYSFDGVDDYISGTTTNLSVQSTDKLTMTAWVKVNQFAPSPAASKIITHTDNLNNGQQYALSIGNDGSLYFLAGNGDFENNGPNSTLPSQITIDTWKHVGAVISDDSVKLFVDGVMVFGKAEIDVFPANPVGNFIFSSLTNSTFNKLFNGTIDDIAIWNRALTASEIQALYTTGQTTYSWSNGATTPSITVTPTTTTTYTCTVTDANGNSCSVDQTITIVPFNGVNAGTDQTICAGGSVSLTATGATTYSWNNNVQNGVAFSPVATSNYIVTGTQNGCTDADTVLVTVVADPVTTSPAAASYCQNGGSVTPLAVNVSGGIVGAYAYQWYANTSVNNFGGSPVLGATTASYTPPISAVGTTYYYCTITQGGANSGCLATSGANGIVVYAQPSITSQPLANQSGCIGAALTPLNVTLTGGNGTPSYQWYSNTVSSTTGGMVIPGANTSSYSAPNTSAGTNYFYCVASFANAPSCATQTSSLSTIALINDPIFSVPPTANQSVCVGGTIAALTFSSTGGSGTASYQWYAVNGSTYTTILGATNPSYTPPIFNIAGNYAYAVAVTQAGNGCASGYSPLANVTVVNDPNVSSPTGSNYCQGGAVSNPLSVSATGGINSAYTYQWYSNGANNNTTGIAIPGATAANYTPPTGNIGTMYYYCQVSQGAGCLSSSPTANITVVAGPALSSQSLGSQSVCVGATLNAYSVSYTGGTGTPSYQWYSSASNSTINGTAISGAIAANYTPGANAVGQTYYYCVLTFNSLTGCSTLTSNAGQVNIITNPTFSIAPLTSQTICQGANPQTLSFTITGGSGTATYQWYNVVNSNYTPIIGANGLTYTPSASLPAGTYNYAVAMTQNASGCSTGFSSNSQLVVLPQPVVSTPQGGVYCQGGSISQPLSVSVTGGNGASNYQWYQSTINNNSGGTAISGATNSTFTPSLLNFGTLYYYCVVTQNAGCTATSAVATVVSNPSPVISTQPTANQTICVGSTPTPLTTSYTGGVGAPSYQWFVNSQNTTLGGSPISGATSNTYIPSNQVGLGSNYYYCVVTLSNSSCPQATTNVAAVNTVANPSMNGPTSATYCQSTSAAQPLSVSASGGNGTSYNYQWYNNVNNANFGGSPISGATNASFTPSINGSSTYYYCVVTQPGGCLSASSVAAIAIEPSPSITSQPLVGQTLCVGGTPQALAITTIGGVSNPSYQWYSNTVNTITNAQAIANATSPNFSPTAVSSTGTTYYFCQVSYAANSACPTLVSNAATIIVVSDPLMSNPTGATYCQNAASVSPLTVNASGGINVGYAYQWYSNSSNSNIGGTAIVGATSNNYFPVVNQLGTTYYYCEVTQGSGCNASSATAAVVVGVAASIAQQPTASQNICLGQSATTLTVGVTAGNYTLSYQWYSNVNNNNFGGTLIVGATNAFYTPPSSVLGTEYYYCVISVAGGGCGTLTTNTAAINVVSAPSMFQPNNQTVCCQVGTAPISFVGNANSYTWTASGSSPLLTGYTANGVGDIPALTLTNNSSTPQNVVYLVIPSNQGCNGTPVQFSINVMPCLSVSTPSAQYYCAQNTVSSYVFSGVGSSFNWVNSNPSIGLQNAGVNFVPNFVAQNSTTTTQTATITVTPSFMGCAGTAQSYTITVYPLPIVNAGVDQAVCSGGSVTLTASGAPNLTWDNGIVNGQTFIPNASTTYTVTGTDTNGCQSQDAVFVQVNQPTSATLNITACDSYTLNGQTYTQSGNYDQLLSNSAGCDSSLTLNLSLNFSPNQPTIYVQNQVNLSTDLIPGLTYQWITCSDLTPIAGQTAITYNPSSNGVYAVVVTNNCGSDTSLCTSITTIGLEESLLEVFELYPNPNNGSFTIEIPEAWIGKQALIYDMQGRLLTKLDLTAKKSQIEMNNFARGAYWLQIDNEVPVKWMKN
ncbi:MAG: T9SS type A sorting domain-containing protein, partial [Sphingomonadales bacterium]|nr:T9SS type A sorting domain-containing protein [Sphingomonadales bacterium]